MKYTFTSRIVQKIVQEKEIQAGDAVYFYEDEYGVSKVKGEVRLFNGELIIFWDDGAPCTIVGSDSFERILPELGLS